MGSFDHTSLANVIAYFLGREMTEKLSKLSLNSEFRKIKFHKKSQIDTLQNLVPAKNRSFMVGHDAQIQ